MALLTNGLETIELGCVTARTILNSNFTLLDASVFLSGLYSAIPAAGSAGRRYYATDTHVLWFDNGASWEVIGGTGGGLPALLGTATGINLKATNNNALATSTGLWIPERVIVLATSVVGFATSPTFALWHRTTGAVETQVSGDDDFPNCTADGANHRFRVFHLTAGIPLATGESLRLIVSVGAGATTFNVSAWTYGMVV